MGAQGMTSMQAAPAMAGKGWAAAPVMAAPTKIAVTKAAATGAGMWSSGLSVGLGLAAGALGPMLVVSAISAVGFGIYLGLRHKAH